MFHELITKVQLERKVYGKFGEIASLESHLNELAKQVDLLDRMSNISQIYEKIEIFRQLFASKIFDKSEESIDLIILQKASLICLGNAAQATFRDCLLYKCRKVFEEMDYWSSLLNSTFRYGIFKATQGTN